MGSFSSSSSAIVSLTYCTLAWPLPVISFFLSLQVLALWCPLQKVHLPMEDSGLEVRFVHMTAQCPFCPHLAQILMVVFGMLEPLSSGGGMFLWLCCMWFSWFVYPCKELVFKYMFSLYVFYLWQFWWILLGYIKARFWPILSPTPFGHVRNRKDYIGISLVVFPCSFLVIFHYYYLSYSCIILG